MTIPTSPAHLPEPDSIAPTITAIAGGDFSRTRLVAFSDLDRARTRSLQQHWLEIPVTERHALLLALARLADESVEFNFNRVFRVALSDPDQVIRQLAIRDLWEDQGSDLPRLLIDIVRNDRSDDVRAAAADALSTAADALLDGASLLIDRDELTDVFCDIVGDASESPIVRRRALGAVAAFDDDPRVPALIRSTLAEDDQSLVAGAIFAMGRTASTRWVPKLIEFMQSEDAELRFEAARAAGSIGDQDAVPKLAELVYDPDSEVRAAALESLGLIGGTAAIRILREAEQEADSDDPELVEDAIDAALLSVNPLERKS